MTGRERKRKTPLILLVEDEPGLQKSLSMLIEVHGYEVVVASEAETGLKILEDAKPDLLITDYMMPGMDGVAMIRKIRKNPRHADLPIILASAVGFDEREIRDIGATAILKKPYFWKRIKQTLETLLDKPANREAARREENEGIGLESGRDDPG